MRIRRQSTRQAARASIVSRPRGNYAAWRWLPSAFSRPLYRRSSQQEQADVKCRGAPTGADIGGDFRRRSWPWLLTNVAGRPQYVALATFHPLPSTNNDIAGKPRERVQHEERAVTPHFDGLAA